MVHPVKAKLTINIRKCRGKMRDTSSLISCSSQISLTELIRDIISTLTLRAYPAEISNVRDYFCCLLFYHVTSQSRSMPGLL